MKGFIYFLLTLLLLLFVSCETNPPNTVEIANTYGKISVNSDVQGAQIFLDNLFTGKITPDTITALVGSHEVYLVSGSIVSNKMSVIVEESKITDVTINLEAGAVSKVVLLEDFGNVSCQPCTISNQIIEEFTNNTYGSTKLITIKFATNFPSPNDPFYLANQQMHSSRNNYYNVLFAPTVIIDGIKRPISTDSNSIKSKIDERLLLEPQFDLSITGNLNAGNYSVDIDLEVLSVDGLDFSNLVLRVYLIETDIEFVSPPGNNGETKFHNVCRSELPSSDGESLSSINAIGNYQYQKKFSTVELTDISKAAAVAFIQNKMTKEVYQTAATY